MRIEPESVIATGTVVLRPWCAGDVEALTAIYSDPLSAQYIEVPQPYNAAQATEFDPLDLALQGSRSTTR